MRRWQAVAVLALAMVLAVGSLPAAAELKVSAPISAVTVYPDRAQVTRRATVSVPVGDEVIVIEGLPAGLDVSTAAVRGEGARPVRLSALEFKRTPLAEVPDAAIESMRRKIEGLELQQSRLDAKQKNLELEYEMVRNLMKFEVAQLREGIQTRPVTPAELEAIMKTLRDKADANRTELINTGVELTQVKKDLELARRELNQLQHPQQKETLAARIPISADRATPVTIELTYIIGGAAWGAAYEVRALTAEGKIALRYDALISQRTGEDWTNAEVTLSTAAPALGASAPEPPASVLYVPAPMRPAAAYSRMAGAPAPAPTAAPSTVRQEVAAAYDADGGGEENLPMEDVVFGLQQASVAIGTTVTYRLPGKATIPSDNEGHRYAIGEQTIPVEFRYRAVPRTREHGYLVAETVYRGEMVLLPGSASIFQDQSFVGTVGLSGIAAGDTLTLQFGPDRRVAVSRQDVEVKRDSSGFGRRQEAVYSSVLVVANHRDVAVGVTLVDRVPTTSVEDVKIEIDDRNPQPDVRRTDGICIWRLNLAPGEERRIPFRYSVSYPENVSLQGLP